MTVPPPKDDFIHPDKTIVSYLKHHPKYKKVYVLAGRVFKNALNESGVIVLDEPIFQHELTLESFSESIVPLEPIDAVIIDVSLDLTYVQYCKAL
uniref:Uncharacterized protein n=1 Tax=Megaselia scalaris TaxID=36166 RepID=T1GH38_MEGSC